MNNDFLSTGYLFEVSWEVCNKVGGIYTVLSSKYLSMVEGYDERYIFIGPDVWKETVENPDFIEDKSLYQSWKESAEKDGLRIRIGRWNIPGRPVAMLIDFTPFFIKKDKIFAEFWETYKLDSLSGGWDYVEPALFGYAAGIVIESFYNFYVTANDKIIGHFHEWMTGAGVLYLKDNVPQVATVFTTHATTLGRSISGNHLKLYSELEKYNPHELAKQLGVTSKFSLEFNSAKEADCFTTVSDLTAKECKYLLLKEPDVVTPNGFSNVFLPNEEEFNTQRKTARARIKLVVESLLNQKIDDNALIILTSGRYEFWNKGIDIYIDALGKLNSDKKVKRQVVALITVPGSNAGPRKDLADHIGKADFNVPLSNEYLTHVLYDKNNDPVLNKIKANNLTNEPGSQVKVVFVPVYLNGMDGIFNFDYYQLLTGFDVTVFPSYYEPWGYTPLESIAFKIPTLTTTLAGFGLWVKSNIQVQNHAVTIIDRTEENYDEVVSAVAKELFYFLKAGTEQYEIARNESFEIAQQLHWDKLSIKYSQSYLLANNKVESRSELFKSKQSFEFTLLGNGKLDTPDWKKIFVQVKVPEQLEPLRELSMNLWWSWNYEAITLFKSIDEKLWETVDHNPVALLYRLSYEKFQALKRNEKFIEQLNEVYNAYKAYMAVAEQKPVEQVAYFSMEFGLHESIKIYSGGLGILAGDYLKEASDSNKNLFGIGLLYRYGYFNQNFSFYGEQIAERNPQKFTELPLIPVRKPDGEWITINLALPGRTLNAKVWKIDVGRIPLYLLDADIDENVPEDRSITHQLYGGDWDNRFKQELLLGIGGIRLIREMGLDPDVYHLNEGHAAFACLERLRSFVEEKALRFETALEVVRSTTLFTTHTPVPAGHDTFAEDMIRMYIPQYADRVNITWEQFMSLGRVHKSNSAEKFSMSVLAAKLSQEVNAVSRIHGSVTRNMFRELYPAFFADELHIGYVTNGVHLPTWAAGNWQKFYAGSLGQDLIESQTDKEYWKKIHNISDQVIWQQRLKAKITFVNFLRTKLQNDLTRRQENPKMVFNILEQIDEKALYIGFARRFATYKRAHLLFSNLEKLTALLNDPSRPLRFVFAGKAHPNDKPGQDLIKRIIEVSKIPQFNGKIIFLENYDMNVAHRMVSGVDIWLNTPQRPMEASGTSGEKAIMNGVINLSVLDGWWAEGYKPNAGWALQEAHTYGNMAFQDELDAETIYYLIEEEILPAYFDIDSDGIPHKWISYMKNNISEIVPNFTMRRMINDYYRNFYSKLFSRGKAMRDNDFALAHQIRNWKHSIVEKWAGVEVISIRLPNSTSKPLNLGEDFSVEIVLNTNGIQPENIGIDIVIGQKVNDKVEDIYHKEELKLLNNSGVKAVYACAITQKVSGVFDFAFRIFPKAVFLPHRQDFNLVKWI
jgi:phosphorylase/glycogen(starch) synthase